MTALSAKLLHLPKILMNSQQWKHENLTYSIFTATYIELHHTKSRFSTSLHSITDISKLHCTTSFQISQASTIAQPYQRQIHLSTVSEWHPMTPYMLRSRIIPSTTPPMWTIMSVSTLQTIRHRQETSRMTMLHLLTAPSSPSGPSIPLTCAWPHLRIFKDCSQLTR